MHLALSKDEANDSKKPFDSRLPVPVNGFTLGHVVEVISSPAGMHPRHRKIWQHSLSNALIRSVVLLVIVMYTTEDSFSFETSVSLALQFHVALTYLVKV